MTPSEVEYHPTAAAVRASLLPLRAAAQRLALQPSSKLDGCLSFLAELLEQNSAALLEANAQDLARMDAKNPKYDRLLLNPSRIAAIATDLRRVAELPSPLGLTQEERLLRNGLSLQRLSVPLGVVGVVFESRPNVTFDVFALCLKAGNAVVLKGSRDAEASNLMAFTLIEQALAKFGLMGCCCLLPADRAALTPLLTANGLVDVIIPRGSQGLIDYVRQHATVAVIETGAGICHLYLDEELNPSWARAILTNAKARRVSVCNALDCLLVHCAQLPQLPWLLEELAVVYRCKVFADPQAYAALTGGYPQDLLYPAQAEHFGIEFLSMQLAVKTVIDLDAALQHIASHGSQHSEAIVSENPKHQERFLAEVDAAAVYVNASTAFTDGG
ncbi:MAG: glutamate-5-semialdehyde dehydrogenase, partial [Lewinella sp.]|nr:glutamate-5-semialdehyde dehydrogenase [Lewinella sp.]